MCKHPLVYLLAKRIDRLMYIPFAFTVVLFLFSAFHHAYPGHSAHLIAEAARLTPSIEPTHPFFATFARLLAAFTIFSLPTQLNLFAAFCGCLSATLFYRLLARTILIYAYDPHEDDPNIWPEDEKAEPPSFDTAYKSVGFYNQRLLSIAIKSSLLATMLLSLMAPFWLASTHLNESIFNLALVLVILTIFPYQESPLCHLRYLLAMMLFAIGLYESAVFVMLLPIIASMAFSFYVGMESRALVLANTLFAGFAGLMIAFSLRPLPPEIVSAPFLLNMERFLKAIVYHHADEFLMLFVTKGWLLILFQTAVPAALLLFGKNLIFDKWSGNTRLASMLILASAIPCALNLPICPFAIYQQVDHLTVFTSVVLAATLAFVLAAALLFFVPKSLDSAHEDVVQLEDPPPKPTDKPAFAFIIILTGITLITPFRSFPYVQAKKSQFVDSVAREMVTMMGERTWMVTNGHIDNHLLIQAHLLKKPLHLVVLRQKEDKEEQTALQHKIERDLSFQHLNRPRLLNAHSIGTIRFVMEWFSSDTNICRKAMVFGMPDLWTATKHRAIPEGLTFGGRPLDAALDAPPLIQASVTLAKQLAPLLIPSTETACPIPERLSALLRLKMGFAVNELGTILEEIDQADEAFAAYQRASQIDPDNVSALLNAYAMATGGKVKNSQVDAMKQRLRKVLQDRAQSRLGLQGIFLNYGTIHQKAFYQQEAETWIARGAQAIASGKMMKSLDLLQQTRANSLIERAHYYMISGKPEQAEACYLAVLEQDPSDFDALYGMTILSININDMPKAEMWLERATSSKHVKNSVILYPTILIAIHKGDKTQALNLLVEATQKYPQDEHFWKLRAVFHLKQGEVLVVRHQILPQMTKALKDPEHYLIHIVRGLMLKQQGPAYYREARISLLKGLSMNASMTETWNTVLELDMLIGSLELMEADIHHLLTLDPDHAQGNYMKGSIQLARKKVTSAEDFIRRSIEKAPSAVACNDLAEILRRQKKLAEAKTFAHQAIALDPNLPHARATLAAILADEEKEQAR
jgi:tetratricopeptide (TPR) repeat protein